MLGKEHTYSLLGRLQTGVTRIEISEAVPQKARNHHSWQVS